MTLLYRPVKIESAEQAEALPIGTYAVLWNTCRIAVKVRAVQWRAESGSYGNRDMLMAEVLMPIEAEEMWGIADADGTTYRAQSEEHARRWQKAMGTALSQRYITPWQEADQ